MSNTTSSVSEILTNTNNAVTVQYSNKTNLNYSTVNSTVNPLDILSSLSDIIPDDGYKPFYVKMLKTLGYDRFMELVAKARAGSDTPQKLFCWMLKNNEQIK